jgi:hypothetical protein
MTHLFKAGLLTIVLIGALFAVHPNAQAQTTAKVDHRGIAREALEKHIQPSYAHLLAAFQALEKGTGDYCAAPDSEGLQTLQARFSDAVSAWGRIAHIVFGPVRENNRYERIWFWPDRKGIARRQVAAALRNRQEGYDAAAGLYGKSIAVQGMGAFEQVIYGEQIAAQHDDSEEEHFICGYIQAIAANLVNIAKAISADWRAEAFGAVWLNPGPDNPSYLNDQETTFALIKAFMDSTERVRDFELARPLGVTERRRVMSGPFATSQLTMVFIAARIAGLHSLFAESGLGEGLINAAKAAEKVQAEADVKQVLFEMRLAEKRSAELAEIPDLLGDSPLRSKAIVLGFPLKSVRQMAAGAAGQLTDLPVGFNASDGD